MSCSKFAAEEESTKLHNCRTPAFSRTVFLECPMITSVTTFVKLPTFRVKLAYEDVPESLVSIINKLALVVRHLKMFSGNTFSTSDKQY